MRATTDAIEKLGELGALYRRQLLEVVGSQYTPWKSEEERLAAFKELLSRQRREREALR